MAVPLDMQNAFRTLTGAGLTAEQAEAVLCIARDERFGSPCASSSRTYSDKRADLERESATLDAERKVMLAEADLRVMCIEGDLEQRLLRTGLIFGVAMIWLVAAMVASAPH